MTDKNAFARENFGLVHACCKRFAGKGIEYDELFAAGSLGLAKAINGFDGGRGLKFSTYAFPMIMGEIKRLFRDGGTVHVSRSLKKLALDCSRLSEEIRLKTGREPAISQLAYQLGVSEEHLCDALNASKLPLSLTSDFDNDEDGAQLDVPTRDIQYEISERLSLEQAISSLADNDKKIINLRYCRGKTQTQTAELLSMTQVQVSRREKKILSLIREKMA